MKNNRIFHVFIIALLSGIRESDPSLYLGKVALNRLTNPAINYVLISLNNFDICQSQIVAQTYAVVRVFRWGG